MPRASLRVVATGEALRDGLAAVRAEHEVPGAFPPEAEAEAAAAEPAPAVREDLEAVPFATLDPEGSRDLDQAFHLERRPGGGWVVRYAIADVAAWVVPGGAIDAEARRRVVTRYLPDGRAPLHPPALSEGRASLLPGQRCPAVVWTAELGADGEAEGFDVRRAWVRSREQLAYPSLDPADERVVLLREVGEARAAAGLRRGAIDLPLPEQVAVARDGGLALERRALLPAERWNAQLSLLTGFCAARRMGERGLGVVRTLPAPDPEAVAALERTAAGIGVPWAGSPAGTVASVDPATPQGAALLEAAAGLLRGAGYAVLEGPGPPPGHAGVAAPYAHVTAPLRRLVDRFALECCLDDPAPWVREALPALPALMAAGTRAAGGAERAVLDLVEAVVLAGRVGEAFGATVTEPGEVVLDEPVVRARCAGDPPVGEHVSVRLAEADVARRRVRFAWPA